MKILNAWIDDPTLDDHLVLEPALMLVRTDSKPRMTIPPEHFPDGWSVSKYGAFVKYKHASKFVDAGDFNVRFKDKFPVLVDVCVLYPGEDEEGEEMFALPLRRARQLIKRNDPSWRLLVSEREAQKGRIMWTPIESHPLCRVCKKEKGTYVFVQNKIEMPLCPVHLKESNDSYAHRRKAVRNHTSS